MRVDVIVEFEFLIVLEDLAIDLGWCNLFDTGLIVHKSVILLFLVIKLNGSVFSLGLCFLWVNEDLHRLLLLAFIDQHVCRFSIGSTET